jgi:hypothetical protein
LGIWFDVFFIVGAADGGELLAKTGIRGFFGDVVTLLPLLDCDPIAE